MSDLRRDNGRLRLSGRVDFESVPGLYRDSLAIKRAESAPKEIDLAEVEHIDSAGLALLLEWESWARQEGTRIQLSNPPQQLLMLAELSELQTVLDFQSSETASNEV